MIALALIGCTAPADVAVMAVNDLGPLETTSAVKARDGGYSAAFEGRTVWLYGDSILALAGEDGSAWRDNSWSYSADLDATDGLTGFAEPVDALGAPDELFPETDAEHAYNEAHRDLDRDGDGATDCEAPCSAREVLWPKAMVAGPDGALLFYVKIHGEPGAWNFYDRGTGIATWASFDAPVVRPEGGPDPDDPTLLWSADEQQPGEAALLDGDTLYAYACHEPEVGWGHECRVARVPVAEALSRDAWTWWDGAAWGTDAADALVVFAGAPQLSVHWSAHLGRWLAVYDALGTIELRTAPAPEGPWSAPVAAFETLAPADPEGWTYCGMAHPELAVDGGRLEYVSYYRSTGDWTGEIRLVELELAGG